MSGTNYVGGLTGANESGATVNNSYATGTVSGGLYNTGGLVGINDGTISYSYATGSVTGTFGSVYIGGLVGYNNLERSAIPMRQEMWVEVGLIMMAAWWEIIILEQYSNSYATGSVSSSRTNYIGGLAGYNSGTINESYSVGTVSGSNSGYKGAFIGQNSSGAYTADYWSTTVDPTLNSSGAGSLTGVTGEITGWYANARQLSRVMEFYHNLGHARPLHSHFTGSHL